MPASTVRNSTVAVAGLKELTITEILDAPRNQAFRTWTEAYHVARWWGPEGFTNPVCEWDARRGGLIRIDMQAPDGTTRPVRGIFHEVIEPTWLDFTTIAFSDNEGDDQLEVRHKVNFEEFCGRTKLTLQSLVISTRPATMPALAGMEEGWNQSFDRLALLLADF